MAKQDESRIEASTMGPRAAVAVVVTHGSRVLLVQRASHQFAGGYWTPVTGRVEASEGHRDAAVREVQEEVGLAVTVSEGPFFECDTEGADFWLRWFRATVLEPSGEASTASSLHSADSCPPVVLDTNEIAQARWVQATELDTISPMFAATREGLRRFFES